MVKPGLSGGSIQSAGITGPGGLQRLPAALIGRVSGSDAPQVVLVQLRFHGQNRAPVSHFGASSHTTEQSCEGKPTCRCNCKTPTLIQATVVLLFK